MKSVPILVSLYRLINSMSAIHKKNLRKSARLVKTETGQKYIILFEIIDHYISQNGEVTELGRFISGSKKFPSKTALYSASNYLFDKIMEQVRNTPTILAQRHDKLVHSLQDIQYLFYQDMFAECYKVIRDAKVIAKEIDRPVYILELQIWEARVAARLNSVTWKLEEVQKEMDEALDNIKSTYSTFLQSQQLYFEFIKDNKDISPETETLLKEVVAKQDAPLEGFSPRIRYWKLATLQYCSELQASIILKSEDHLNKQIQVKDANYYLKQNLDFLSSKPGSIIAEEEPVNYFSVLENYLNKCLIRKDKESFLLLESEFVENYFKEEDIQRYRIICYYKILYYLTFNQFQDACKYMEDQNLEANLVSRQHLIGDQRMSVIRYSCAQAYFLNSSFDKAFKWAEYLIRNPRSQSNQMVLKLTELMFAICLFETKTFSSIQDQLNNLNRKYKRREPKNKFLHELIAALKYAARPQHELYRKTMIDRKNKINMYIAKSPALTVYGPLLAWLDSRITGNALDIEILKYNDQE